jgi:nucleoside-diphosphate-sugar epimerase
MRILLIGGNGFIGRFVVAELKQQGARHRNIPSQYNRRTQRRRGDWRRPTT